MIDHTEKIRRKMVEEINEEVKSNDSNEERKRLEEKYSQVWNTKELQEDFEITAFMAPFVGVTRKSDRKEGIMMFQHLPRFYFSFQSE